MTLEKLKEQIKKFTYENDLRFSSLSDEELKDLASTAAMYLTDLIEGRPVDLNAVEKHFLVVILKFSSWEWGFKDGMKVF